MPRPGRRLLLYFAAIFVPLAAVISAIVLALYWSQDAAQRESRRAAERDVVARSGQVIAGELRTIVADTMIMSQLGALRALLDQTSPERRRALGEEYRLFLDQRRVYDQARLLDRNGMEVVRVNYQSGRGEVVPDDKLQDKHDRYYFEEAARLAPGQLYVSPFDLNVEDDAIEEPIKPTIRFAAPVYGDDGALAGVVILNYLGRNLLDKLRAASAGTLGNVALLNDDGYWLLGPLPQQEWGFMYPDRRHVSLAHEFPHAWQAIAGDESGQLEADDGLWTFQRVRPFAGLPIGAPPTGDLSGSRRLQEANRVAGEIASPAQSAKETASHSSARGAEQALQAVSSDSGDYSWRIVSHVRDAIIARETTRLRQGFWRLFASLMLVLAIVSWLWARVALAHRAAREQLLQSERLSAIGEAMTALAHESRNALQRSQAGLDMLAKRVADRPEAVQLLGEVQQAQYFLRDQYEAVREYAAPMRLECEAVDLRNVVGEVWHALAERRAGRDVSVVEQGGEAADDATVWADRRAAGQVIRNLLENALDASPPVSRIEVAYAPDRLDHRAAVRIAVRDDGPGMSAEQRLRAFEPFYTTKPRGTGLGMAICRRIVEAHGGSIVLADDNRSGAEIIILWPKPTK